MIRALSASERIAPIPIRMRRYTQARLVEVNKKSIETKDCKGPGNFWSSHLEAKNFSIRFHVVSGVERI
jgi:hypothetical protein